MGIYLPNMEMPESCYRCPMANDDFYLCGATEKYLENDSEERRPDWCPLVEIPTPHGRLIDADEPMTKISTMMQEPDYQHEGENWMVGLIMARDALDDAPTVIEA